MPSERLLSNTCWARKTRNMDIFGTFGRMVDVIPEGTAGNARVTHRRISAEAARFDVLRASMKGYAPCREGTICQLFVDGDMMMSDGGNEHETNREVVFRAQGDVLIAGLGIGMVLIPILCKPEVRTVTVLEKSSGVIELVEIPVRRHLGLPVKSKLTVIKADAFKWQPSKGVCFDTIYLDIWPDICTDNLKDITKLKRHFARRLRPGGWMGAWVEHKLRRLKRHEVRW